MINEIMEYNKKFVENKAYEPYLTSKYPDKKLAILTCMDTRLIELLPAALGLKNGDAKIIKNAGGVITHPYGSVVRSLLVAIIELGVEEVMVIGHTDCGVQGMDGGKLLEELTHRGISQEHIDIIRSSGINLEKWLGGFDCVEQSVKDTILALQKHPLMPKDIMENVHIQCCFRMHLKPQQNHRFCYWTIRAASGNIIPVVCLPTR